MNKVEISSLLQAGHKQFIEMHATLNEQQFKKSNNGKWNPSQELDHIIRAVQPVVLALSFPNLLLRIAFGKANRPSKTYEGLIDKYTARLSVGGRARGRFVPVGISFANRALALKKLESLIVQLNRKTNAKSEQELDTYILPHPLLGKLTLREMLYFTAYHVEHHRKNTIKNLELNSVAT